MKYTVEDLSPVKKCIKVTVSADDVDNSLNTTVAIYAANVKMDGFRKGKAPAQAIERRFKQDIYSETLREVINRNIGEIFNERDMEPLTGVEFDGPELERGKEYVYTVTFEVLPEFEMPAYEGMDVEKEKIVIDPEDVEAMVERIRGNMAEMRPIAEQRKPQDGDVLTVDFEGSIDGKILTDVKGEYFQMVVGDGSTIPDFDALARTAMPDEQVEGKVTFPEDYGHADLAGKTVDMKILLRVIMERHLPPLDDEVAKRAGLETLEQMRETIRESYASNREGMAKSIAQKSLLDKLLTQCEFPLPERMVEGYIDTLLENKKESLQSQSKNLEDDGKTIEDWRNEFRAEAEDVARAQVFLLSVAKKEKITVSDREMDMLIQQMASRYQQDAMALRQHYIDNNMIPVLRDRILADKAMEAVYAKANVIEVEGKPENPDKPKAKSAKAKPKAEAKEKAAADGEPKKAAPKKAAPKKDAAEKSAAPKKAAPKKAKTDAE